tara:strand:+ start:185 stop:748 length:564 start_codon:yes stop_codon:yes gene_type:complete
MLKLWIDNTADLAVPILFCLGKHRLVNSEYNLFQSTFKSSVKPIVESQTAKELLDNPKLSIVKDPAEADQHWFVKTNYTTYFWWYMVNEGLINDNWKQIADTYTELDARYNILYGDHVKNQHTTLDMYSDTSTMIPFFGWNIDVLKIGFNLPPDMESDMAANAWQAWLEKYTPNAVKVARRPVVDYN